MRPCQSGPPDGSEDVRVERKVVVVDIIRGVAEDLTGVEVVTGEPEMETESPETTRGSRGRALVVERPVG